MDTRTNRRISRFLRLTSAAIALASYAHAAPALTYPTEVQVGTRDITDYEFDWGRDGRYCPTCNFGAGNARLSYVDKNWNLWVGYIDANSGYLYPANGQAVLVDKNVTTAAEIGNGPEWMLSQHGSELVYTRWTDEKPHYVNYLTVGYAHTGNGSWIAGPIEGTNGQIMPIGSSNIDDPAAMVHYQNFSKVSTNVFWRVVTPGSAAHQIPLGSTSPGVTRRWIPGTHKMILSYPAPPDAYGNVYRQVFLYDTKTNTTQQLTFDPVNKYWSFMWPAPEYDNEYLFFVMVGGNEVDIYRKTSVGGVSQWTVIKRITMPADMPYVSSPEPFVHNGLSWIFFTISASPDGKDYSATSQVAMTGIVPGTSTFKILTSDDIVARARRDPEYYITANGPYLYYNRYVPSSSTVVSEGVFRVDTGLGPPQN